jgi:mRNA-degrading endonuclease toxin of MazEF toxin-antitoxin module
MMTPLIRVVDRPVRCSRRFCLKLPQMSVKKRAASFLALEDRLPFWMRSLRILFPLVLFSLASCSGSEKPSAALSSLRASGVSTTTVAAVTSGAVASTAAAVTVPPSTTSTTAAKSLEVVVAEAAVQNWMVDRLGCLLAMDVCDPTSYTPDGSVQRQLVTKTVNDYRRANLKVRTNTNDPSY